MWLPREERQLLMFYSAHDPDFHGNGETFSVDQLQEVATRRLCAGQTAERAARVREARKGENAQHTEGESNHEGSAVSRVTSWLQAKGTIESANNRLRERELVEVRDRGFGYWEVKVNLTGWDPGNKYLCLWTRSCLWFRE